MKDEILFFDSTLRDGSHAVKHQLSENQIRNYCQEINTAGLDVVIVGHGNGLGASSLQVGISALSDEKMICIARSELKNTKLGVFLIPGFGTIRDDLGPAIDYGVDLVCVAAHCTEADITRQHIEYVRRRGKDAYGVLLMYHMTDIETLLQEALKMQEYGAQGVILMDSAGASTMKMVEDSIKHLTSNLDIKVGFHAHNNLGLAVANSFVAIEYGATIIDGTLRGFGAGAGNCPLEVLAALLKKSEIENSLDCFRLMDVSEDVVKNIMPKPQEINSLSLASGLAGVFSGFALPVKRIAAKYGVDPKEIMMELGKRKILAGQEDYIVEVAVELANRKIEEQGLSF